MTIHVGKQSLQAKTPREFRSRLKICRVDRTTSRLQNEVSRKILKNMHYELHQDTIFRRDLHNFVSRSRLRWHFALQALHDFRRSIGLDCVRNHVKIHYFASRKKLCIANPLNLIVSKGFVLIPSEL